MPMPAFVTIMVANPAQPPSHAASRRPSTRSSSPTHRTPRKRVRRSELSRKYRPSTSDTDEAILIDDSDSLAFRDPPSSSPHDPHSTPSSPPARIPPIRFSRFPSSGHETVTQVASAVVTAFAQGHDRIRVDVKRPHLIADAAHADAFHSSIVLADSSSPSPHLLSLALLVRAACATVSAVLALDPTHSRNPGLGFAPRTAALYFNSEADARIGRRYVPPELKSCLSMCVLGESCPQAWKADVAVVVAPCNTAGNPAHIEAVEHVHYGNWTAEKIVIMMNPELVALTGFARFEDEPREPSFLADYVPSYYIDPAAFPSRMATGAVLRCYPRKWEMYLLKVQSDMGFRLVAEQQDPPSEERIHYEFAWRVGADGGKSFLE